MEVCRSAPVSFTSLLESPLLSPASMLEACKAVDLTLPIGVSNCYGPYKPLLLPWTTAGIFVAQCNCRRRVVNIS